MKFNHFQDIVHRICDDIPCPRCRGDFDELDIEVQGASEKNIEFFAECPHCGAEVCISAHIQTRVPIKQNGGFLQRKHKGIRISPDNIQRITNTLQNFRGKDVRELF